MLSALTTVRRFLFPPRSGTFVLRDTQFRWLTRLSQNQMPPQVGQRAAGASAAAAVPPVQPLPLPCC